MLFNTFHFLAFLIVFLVAFYAVKTVRARKIVVVVASLGFYAWYYWPYLFLLAGSMAVNYTFGRRLAEISEDRGRDRLVAAAIVANLAVLGYFKYLNFVIETLNAGLGFGISPVAIALPLAISFYTFHQIIFLIDVRNTRTCAPFLDYAFYIVFFPQLIAGPLVRSQEIFPQLRMWPGALRPFRNLVVGSSVFVVGLAKKVLIADTVAVWADSYFDGDWSQRNPSLIEAWAGALSYSFQLYFDFSGYSDMALGLALMVGIKLPLNFYSPYKSTSIIDFWRRWHVTLSRFLRDYLYIPLGGSRFGERRRYFSLVATMLLGGLWHGAAWTFVAWGGLHGLMLALNHAMRRVRAPRPNPGPAVWLCKVVATFVLVTLAWVMFRAPTFDFAAKTLAAMLGFGGFRVPDEIFVALGRLGISGSWIIGSGSFTGLVFFGRWQIAMLVACVVVCIALPNTFELMRLARIGLDPTAMKGADRSLLALSWRPRPQWMAYAGVLLVLSLMSFGSFSPFLYFQF